MSSEQHKTQRALIQAATELLETQGLAAVTLRAVGQRAGVSRTTPYRHFENKEALLSAVALQFFEHLEEQLTEGLSREDAAHSRLEALLLTYVHFILQHPERYRLMLGHEVRSAQDETIYAASQRVFALFVQEVARAQEEGTLAPKDSLQVAALLFSSGHGIADLALGGYMSASKGLEPERLVCLLIERLR